MTKEAKNKIKSRSGFVLDLLVGTLFTESFDTDGDGSVSWKEFFGATPGQWIKFLINVSLRVYAANNMGLLPF